MNKLTIKLSGMPGSGKSTIAVAITEFLKEKGFEVSVRDSGEPPSDQERSMESMKMHTKIDVITEKAYRTVKVGRNEFGLIDVIPTDKDQK